MRIVGGKYKGRTLTLFAGQDVRPTADKVRESIFNILQFEIYNKTFLDAFCGTGAMGIEALSRGAKSVTFNDLNAKSLEILKKNLAKLNVTESYQVRNGDAISFLSLKHEYDYIYIDPPYKSDLGYRALSVLKNSLATDGVVIFEDEKVFDGEIDGLTVFDRRKYGRVHLTFFRKETL